MPIIKLDISGPSYSWPSSQVTADQASVNMYPVLSSPSNSIQSQNPLYNGRGQATMLPTPGFSRLTTLAITNPAVDPGCAGIYLQSITANFSSNPSVIYSFYGVFQGALCRIRFTLTDTLFSASSYTILGNLTTANQPLAKASFATVGKQLLIQYGGGVSCYNVQTGVLSSVGPSGITLNPGLVMIDGYFFVSAVGTDQFYSSNINDGTVWNLANTARMQSSSDQLCFLAQSKGELWGFGFQSIEVWYDAANATGMPFSKRVGSDNDVGTVSPYTIQSINSKLFWLDARGYVAMSDYSQFFRNQSSGYNITKVSDDAIDQIIEKYPSKTRIFASSYRFQGQVFYELTMPTVTNVAPFGSLNFPGRTFVLNTNNYMWHERTYTDPNTGVTRESFTNQYAQFGDIAIAGSATDNGVYLLGKKLVPGNIPGIGAITTLTDGVYNDAGSPVYRYRKTKLYNNDFKQITVNSLEVKCLVGQADGVGVSSTSYTVASWANYADINGTINKTAFGISNQNYCQGHGIISNVLNMDGTNTITIPYKIVDSNIDLLFAGTVVAFQPTTTYVADTGLSAYIVGFQQIWQAQIVSYDNPDNSTTNIVVKFLDPIIPAGTWPNPAQTNVNPVVYIADPTVNNVTTYFDWPNNILTYTANDVGLLAMTGATITTTLPDSSTISNKIIAPITDNNPPGGPVDFNLDFTKGGGIQAGNSFFVQGSLYVYSITLSGTPTININDVAQLTLNDGTILGLRVVTVNGNTITFTSPTPLLSSQLTVGNNITLIVNGGTPTIDMRYSIDSGYTWSQWKAQSLGITGAYSTRCIWNLLGTALEWEIEFRIIGDVKWSIVEAIANVSLENG